jgi:GT2 family glycosyltransferase
MPFACWPAPAADVATATAAETPPSAPPGPRCREAYRQARWRRQLLESSPVDISVCIANWNCRDLLRACLGSLLDRPQGVHLEVIVVDNASTDGAAAMVAEEFPEVVLRRNPTNFGFARANNQAARLARGRYLFFLNNDTEVPDGALRRLLTFAEEHPEIGLLGPRLRDAQGRIQVSYRMRPTMAALLHRTSLLRWTGLLRASYRRYRRREFDPQRIRHVDLLMGAAMLLPRSIFRSCGGWDEDFVFGGEDLELSARVKRRHPVVFFPDVEIMHHGRVSTRQQIGFASTQTAIGFVRYLRKTGCTRSALLVYKLVVTLDAPLRFLAKVAQYAWQRLRGRCKKAEKSLLTCKGLGHFLTKGLPAFWKA